MRLTLYIDNQVLVPRRLGSKPNSTCPSGHHDRPIAQQADSSAAFHSFLAVLRQPIVFPPGFMNSTSVFSRLLFDHGNASPQSKNEKEREREKKRKGKEVGSTGLSSWLLGLVATFPRTACSVLVFPILPRELAHPW